MRSLEPEAACRARSGPPEVPNPTPKRPNPSLRRSRTRALTSTYPLPQPDFGEALTQFEASPMLLQEVGELVFRVQRFRESASRWLRGCLRTECMHD